MSNKKISALTAASTPLVGTEVLPIVQSGATVQVSVANLTIGRSVTAGALTNLGDVSLGNKSGTNDLTISGAATASVVTVGRLSSTSGDNTQFAVQNRLGTQTFLVNPSGNGSAAVTGTLSVTRGVTLCSATGDTNTGVGNIVQGTAGQGFNFTANTGAAGKTSQLLNWYEEGTWTPTAFNLTVVGTLTYTGKYTRIGRQVTCIACIDSTTSTASTAGLTSFGGLPFTAAAIAGTTAGNGVIVDANTITQVGAGYIFTGNNRFYVTAWTATANIVISFTYFV